MSQYVWTDDMREISGFGGSYERGCRAMVSAGLEWLEAHPGEQPVVKEYANIIGVALPSNAAAEEMEKAMLAAPVTMEDSKVVRASDEASGAMVHYAHRHIAQAAKLGWDAYAKLMRDGKDK